jgi:hypothetical protein
MWNVFVAAVLPVLLVFGLYHLITWFNLFHVNGLLPWKRVGTASAIAHFLLATGFFVFSYVDYQANRDLSAEGMSYGTFLVNKTDFWRLITLYDTLPMAATLAVFAALDRFGLTPPGVLAMILVIVYVLGTIQWYFIGGVAGALLGRFWDGLKSPDDEEAGWF